MRDDVPSSIRGNKVLLAILITANLLMLVIGILTIPPNLVSAEGKESPVLKAEKQRLAHRRRRKIRCPRHRRWRIIRCPRQQRAEVFLRRRKQV